MFAGCLDLIFSLNCLRLTDERPIDPRVRVCVEGDDGARTCSEPVVSITSTVQDTVMRVTPPSMPAAPMMAYE